MDIDRMITAIGIYLVTLKIIIMIHYLNRVTIIKNIILEGIKRNNKQKKFDKHYLKKIDKHASIS